MGRTARAHAVPYLLVLPAVLVIALVLGYPMYRLIGLSFQHYALAEIISHKTTWIGLSNYSTIFTDAQFWTILQRTVEFTAFNVGATMVIGTAIAMLLRNVSGWVKVLVNTAMVFVWATPVVVAVTVWQWLVDQQSGVLNYLLTHVLHVGNFERPRPNPQRPLDVLLQAFSIARNERFARESELQHDGVEVMVLPGVDPGPIKRNDFSKTEQLIKRAHATAAGFLDAHPAAASL